MKSKTSASSFLSIFVAIAVMALLFAIATPLVQSVRSNALRSAAATQAASVQNAIIQNQYESDEIDGFLKSVSERYDYSLDTSDCSSVKLTVTDKRNPTVSASRSFDLSDFDCSF